MWCSNGTFSDKIGICMCSNGAFSDKVVYMCVYKMALKNVMHKWFV